MSIIDAIILGIIQGLTEFLPVSSSGHLELGKAILGQELEAGLLFSVVLHAATALSTIVIFWKDIYEVIGGLFAFKWNESSQFAVKIIISMVPVFFVGVFLKDEIEVLFGGQILLVGSMLILTGFLLLLTNYFGNKEGEDVNFFQALLIGVSQAIAVLPGISRSGATISTALILGVGKSQAARFSFLMVLIPILGATILELKDYFEATEATQTVSVTALVAGFVVAFLTGLVACTWMINLVKKGKLAYFAIYCFIVGAIAIIYTLI
ncbi:MAG: UDP-diphosphatase [Thalassobius sp.]|nr:UDP-diphosphatase [Thalassovita sp.]